jgi:hypothetical protein
MKASGRIVDCGIIEREVLELLHSNDASEKGATHVIESTEQTEFYYIWPIPLIFDEFTVD